MNAIRFIANVAILMSGALNAAAYEQQLTVTGVTASHTGNGANCPPTYNCAASLAVDGNASTYWSSGQPASSAPYIIVDVGSVRAISHVELDVIMSPNGNAEHQVYTSPDNVNWTLLKQIHGYAFDGQVFIVPVHRDARYLSVQTTVSPSWVNWREIRVYGPVSGASSAPQFIAKLFTEAYGEAPDKTTFDSYSTTIAATNCSVDSLRWRAWDVFTSTKYSGLYGSTDYEAKLITLYRAVLSREPDQSGFDYWVQRMTGAITPQLTFLDVAYQFIFNTSEFSDVAAAACRVADPSYGMGPRLYTGPGSSPEWDQPATTSAVLVKNTQYPNGIKYTAAQVQTLLNGSQSTISLEPYAVVEVDTQITIPAGKTLTTQGSLGVTSYAKMARFVRKGYFNASLIDVSGGATLERVWVDGGRGQAASNDSRWRAAANVSMSGNIAIGKSTRGLNNRLRHVKADNTLGGMTVFLAGRTNGIVCADNEINNSLFTSYSSRYQPMSGRTDFPGVAPWILQDALVPTWADAITNFCEDVTVEYNHFVDMTDGSVILFSGIAGVEGTRAQNAAQKSQVRNNVAVSAGNPGYWGMVLDPATGQDSNYPYPRMFDGATIEYNNIWTSSMAHVVTVFGAGTRSLYGTDGVMGSCKTGASVNAPSPAEPENRESGFVSDYCRIQHNTFIGNSTIEYGIHGLTGVLIQRGSGSSPTPVSQPAPFSCTPTTTSQPIVCSPGSGDEYGNCPTGSIVPTNSANYLACYS